MGVVNTFPASATVVRGSFFSLPGSSDYSNTWEFTGFEEVNIC
jgi:hypothetical protein